MTKPLQRSRAFTLVELLIVVAIIGILSTVGIPTYQRMVQKSRKTEAKVLLGGVHKVQSTFFSEYGTYGTVLNRMGFQVSGRSGPINHQGRYTFGFPDAACVTIGIRPLSASVYGAPINRVFPDYYNPPFETVYITDAVKALPFFGPCLVASATPLTYLSTASGVIAAGVPPNTTNGALIDQWSINENRQLINAVDGVQ